MFFEALDAAYFAVSVFFASNLDYFYISTDLSGNIYITNKAVSEEILAYNQLMYENNTIKGLEQLVANEYDTALKNDEQLAEFVNNLGQ